MVRLRAVSLRAVYEGEGEKAEKMTDWFDNVQVMGVEKLTLSLKRVVEGSFSRVRVRGELRGVKVHGQSGHMYGSVREGNSVMDVVCWRSRRRGLKVEPEEGMDVVLTGRVTVYGGRSRYQLDIESMELAGEGAIEKMLFDRRVRLEKEGLFLEERKRSLPLWSEVVGVVSSPLSAAMHDIVQTAGMRMGVHILVWPSLMQGEGASREVVAGLEGFNGLRVGGKVPRPDVIIVARGGGSVEDLLPFSDEVLLRSVAKSVIPVVSAIGHESDHCLLDEVADVRVATPTAAAMRVVPLKERLEERVVFGGERLWMGVRGVMEREARRLLSLGVISPYENVRRKEGVWREKVVRWGVVRVREGEKRGVRFREAVRSLVRVLPETKEREARFARGIEKLWMGVRGVVERGERLWKSGSRLLDSLDVRAVLRRGFVVVRNGEGRVVTDCERAREEEGLRLQFLEGEVFVKVEREKGGG